MASTPASGAPTQTGASPQDTGKFTSALKQLYTTKDPKEQDKIIDEMYSTKTEFDDNLTRVYGPLGVKLQFHALPKLFKSASWEEQSSEMKTEGTGQVLTIMCDQSYVWGSKTIPIKVQTTLTLDEQGKITKHHDKWQGKWANPYFLRRTIGGTSSLFIKALGW